MKSLLGKLGVVILAVLTLGGCSTSKPPAQFAYGTNWELMGSSKKTDTIGKDIYVFFDPKTLTFSEGNIKVKIRRTKASTSEGGLSQADLATPAGQAVVLAELTGSGGFEVLSTMELHCKNQMVRFHDETAHDPWDFRIVKRSPGLGNWIVIRGLLVPPASVVEAFERKYCK